MKNLFSTSIYKRIKLNGDKTKAKPQLVSGFTLIEILVAIAIFLILGAIFIGVFVSLNREQALFGGVTTVKAVLSEARSKTLSSEGSLQYGVHFDDTSGVLTLFEGGSYDSGAPTNMDFPLHSFVDITDVSLSGGGDDIIFKKLTGETDQDGEVVLLVSDGSEFRYATVTIYATGVVE